MKQQHGFVKNEQGYAVVEATILFPIIMMVFAGLVLLSMYLPTRAVLQRETQYAATVLATTESDTWLGFDTGRMEYYWLGGSQPPENVYVALISSLFKGNSESKAKTIVETRDESNFVTRAGNLTVECKVNNFVIYKEIVVTATRTIPSPVNLSFVNFPSEIPITVSSTAVVQNGDEFVRDIDIAKDFLDYLNKEVFNNPANTSGVFKNLSNWINKAWKFLGI